MIRRDYVLVMLSVFMLILLAHQIDQERRIECVERGQSCPSWLERTAP